MSRYNVDIKTKVGRAVYGVEAVFWLEIYLIF